MLKTGAPDWFGFDGRSAFRPLGPFFRASRPGLLTVVACPKPPQHALGWRGSVGKSGMSGQRLQDAFLRRQCSVTCRSPVPAFWQSNCVTWGAGQPPFVGAGTRSIADVALENLIAAKRPLRGSRSRGRLAQVELRSILGPCCACPSAPRWRALAARHPISGPWLAGAGTVRGRGDPRLPPFHGPVCRVRLSEKFTVARDSGYGRPCQNLISPIRCDIFPKFGSIVACLGGSGNSIPRSSRSARIFRPSRQCTPILDSRPSKESNELP